MQDSWDTAVVIRSLRILAVTLASVLVMLAFFRSDYEFIGLGLGLIVGVLVGWHWLGLALAEIGTVPYVMIAAAAVVLGFLCGFLGIPEPVASFMYVLGVVTALQMFVRRFAVQREHAM